MKSKKKDEAKHIKISYHRSHIRLQLGDIVHAPVGAKIKGTQRRERKYGQIIKSVDNNTYLISFEDGLKRELRSSQISKPKSKDEVEAYKHHLTELLSADTDSESLSHESKMLLEDYNPLGYCQHIPAQDMFHSQPSMSTPTNTKNKSSKTSSQTQSSKSKKSSSTKTNTAVKIENEYDTQVKKATEEINRLIEEQTTYTVSSAGDTMTWKVIAEHVVLGSQHVPIRHAQDLGIKDIKLRELLRESDLPLADLVMMLLYKNGEWERYLEKMNKAIIQSNEINFRKKEQSHRRVSTFSKEEFLVGHAIIIGAADCSAKGEKLWNLKTEEVQKQWVSIAKDYDFSAHMKFYRFKQFKHFFPMIWEDTSLLEVKDPWWKFAQAVEVFNEIRRELILPCEVVVVDESMSAFRPQTTATGGLPKLTFIIRKPENLGTEFKTSVCPMTGVMTFMEIQRGKEDMKTSQYTGTIRNLELQQHVPCKLQKV